MALQDIDQGVENIVSGIDPKSTAILVIDELGSLDGSPLEPVLKAPTLNTAKIARAARAKSIPVIFANDAHIKGLDRELELWGEHGIAGTPEAQTSPELEQQDGDFLIEKRRYSAFFQTGLRLLLDELGVRTLILCGFDTNICVVHTAADAYFNNFDLIVVSDATGTFLIGDQAEGLEYMNRCYAAKVVDTEAVLGLLA
ncbi:MAG: cysteine hydrolase [Eggerthellaceae bacterium]|nr:cysteine hydrolase [Eggerthellaceae bacterium]